MIGFHPLKAGRRPSCGRTFSKRLPCFHPLKAGRRLKWVGIDIGQKRQFPSPQGGSETAVNGLRVAGSGLISIPSRRVGDRRDPRSCDRALEVSIPSRRVGDIHSQLEAYLPGYCFHPLKAGRRRRQHEKALGAFLRFHPLKAGRRPCVVGMPASLHDRFHPLKAGRRH